MLRELENLHKELTTVLNPVLKKRYAETMCGDSEVVRDSKGWEYLQLRRHILLAYCMNICFYLRLKAEVSIGCEFKKKRETCSRKRIERHHGLRGEVVEGGIDRLLDLQEKKIVTRAIQNIATSVVDSPERFSNANLSQLPYA